MTTLLIDAIAPDVLDRLRVADAFGRAPVGWTAEGGEPLRCCLTAAEAREEIALVSYSPMRAPGPWQEVGPVFIHRERCAGRASGSGLPAFLRHGPRVLRAYREDGAMDYDANTVVADGADVEAALRAVLSSPGVVEVHARALEPQCFTFAARFATDG